MTPPNRKKTPAGYEHFLFHNCVNEKRTPSTEGDPNLYARVNQWIWYANQARRFILWVSESHIEGISAFGFKVRSKDRDEGSVSK